MKIDNHLNINPAQIKTTDNRYSNHSDSELIKHLGENFERFADPRHRNQFVTRHSLTDVAERDKHSKNYNKDDSEFAGSLLSSPQLLESITDFKKPIRHDDGVFISKSDVKLFNSKKDSLQPQEGMSY
ncbi:hypothetical protein ACEK06_23765 [Pseudomonas brenneri]|uniref:hypothetical protein n=1 Tax=Pseudomonas brenneri TaxID=129817 RepID=UPI003570DCF9